MKTLFGSMVSAAVLFVLALTSPNANAQAVYGSIFGTVTDPTGAVVPGAEVTITNIGQQKEFKTVTNASGGYSQGALIPGRYQVKIELTGFKTFVQETVEVKVDAATRVDAVLQVGQVAEVITVTGEVPVLKTDRADVATSFDTKQVEDLPIFDRNFTKMELFTPGTQQLGWQHASSENPQGSIQIMVNGQHFSGTAFQLDGTDNRDPILGIIVINPTLDSVTEAKITSQNYDAEFGQAISGVVTAQTKSGTNELHGSLFDFRRNDVTSARNPFSQSQLLSKDDPDKFIPDTLWNQFGASLGGPIAKNRSFYFGDYQGTRRKNGGSVLTTVPTARARTGDLSEYGINIFDPTTGNPTTGKGRSQFAGNMILSSRLSSQAQNLLKLIPPPNRPGIENNFSAGGIEAFDSDQFNARIDHYYSEKLHIFGRYSFARFNKSGPGAFGELVGGPAFDNIFFSGKSDVRNQSIAAGFDYPLSPYTLTDFRFGFFRYKVNVLPNGLGTSPAKDAGIPGLNLDEFFTSGMPTFFINGTGGFRFGYSLGVNQCNCPLDQREQQWQFVNNWTFLRGTHSFKVGADLRYAQNLRVPSDVHRSGELSFNNERTQGDTGGGLGLATFLIGEVSSFGRYVSSVTDAGERQKRFFWYAQDTWRVTPKLTLNYGLRWEQIFPERVTKKGDGGWPDLSTGKIQVAEFGNINLHGNVNMEWKNFAPRLGVAYQVTEKTVLRAGYGKSYDIGVFGSVFGHAVTQNLPVLAIQSVNPPDNFLSVFNLKDGPTAPVFPPVPSDGLLTLPDGVSAFIRTPKIRLPSVDTWNLTLQHQLTQTVAVEAAYVGNKGTHVFAGDGPDYDLNQPILDGFGTLSTNQRRPFFNGPIRGFGKPYGWSQGFHYFGNDSSNNFHSLQTKVTRRFANGLSLLSHYTWSKGMNYDSGYYIWNARLAYGPNSFDRTHIWVLTANYDLPIGKGRKWLDNASRPVDLVLGGWQVNTVTNWYSGLPFDVGYRDSGADRDTGPGRPDVVGNFEVSNPSQYGWFATAGKTGLANGETGGPWRRPARGTFGTLSRNALRGPRLFNTDFSVFKNARVTEKVNAQFRVEIFNLWNHVNLGNPNSCIDCNPANDGKIFGLAPGASMRQVQFALKFLF